MKGLMRFLARAKLVELSVDESAVSPSPDEATTDSPGVPAAEIPISPLPVPEGGIDEGVALDDIFALAGVSPSPFPAEKLLRLLDGLRAMDAATRKTAVLAMDAAEDSWQISDPVLDAQRKIAALEAYKRRLAAQVAAAEEQVRCQDRGRQERPWSARPQKSGPRSRNSSSCWSARWPRRRRKRPAWKGVFALRAKRPHGSFGEWTRKSSGSPRSRRASLNRIESGGREHGSTDPPREGTDHRHRARCRRIGGLEFRAQGALRFGGRRIGDGCYPGTSQRGRSDGAGKPGGGGIVRPERSRHDSAGQVPQGQPGQLPRLRAGAGRQRQQPDDAAGLDLREEGRRTSSSSSRTTFRRCRPSSSPAPRSAPGAPRTSGRRSSPTCATPGSTPAR